MELNKKIIPAKLSPSGDNLEYQEETENDAEDDDVYMEQNFTDVNKKRFSHGRVRKLNW